MCTPALGGRIEVEDENYDSGKKSRAYMLANPPPSNKFANVKSTKKTMVSKLDMFRHGLIHLDMS